MSSSYASLSPEEAKEIGRFEASFKAAHNKDIVLVAYGK